ncbi:hypothetical protein EMIT0P74_10526 [Pseudomonas sp. IT-P74]
MVRFLQPLKKSYNYLQKTYPKISTINTAIPKEESNIQHTA